MAKNDEIIYVNMNTENAVSATQALDKELLVLRLALGKLRADMRRAVAPIGAVFVPVMQQASWSASRLVKSVGKVVAALFGYNTVLKTTAKTEEKIRRSLMDFDEINRLKETSGGVDEIVSGSNTLTPELQAAVDKIMALLAPLQTIDFTPAIEAFGRLKEAIEPLSQTLFAGLEWAWHNLLVPLTRWTIEDYLPVFLDTLASLLQALNAVIIALQPAANWLWERFLQPLAQWTGALVLDALKWLRERLDSISRWASDNSNLSNLFLQVATAIGSVAGAVGGLSAIFLGSNNSLSQMAVGVGTLTTALGLLMVDWEWVEYTALHVWQGIKTVWGTAGTWFKANVLDVFSSHFKNMANGIIGFLNGLITAAQWAANGIVKALNSLSFTVPNWVPQLGGKTMGFHLKQVSIPQIPYLAQGAVLPANKPFLAVVGDQKHGTNVEAPLETIQQAVAAVMGDQTSAILAGFATSVEVQREILQAVLGIQIGDEVIGNAMSRYRQKMTVVNGGLV